MLLYCLDSTIPNPKFANVAQKYSKIKDHNYKLNQEYSGLKSQAFKVFFSSFFLCVWLAYNIWIA